MYNNGYKLSVCPSLGCPPTTHVIRKFLHQLPIEFNFPKAQWCKIPHPLPRIGETSGSTSKMHFILSFRKDETQVKIQMFDIFHRKPDVYIRQLQVRMRISAINSPTPQRLVRRASSGLMGCRRRRLKSVGEFRH